MSWSPDNAPPRKHCIRYNTPNHAHYLTFSCFHRQPFLLSDRTRQWLADAIRRARDKHAFRLLAWVFMPEHAHLLIHPRREHYSISAILQSIKLPVARHARIFVLQSAPHFLPHMQLPSSEALHFWQAGGGYDRNTFSSAELWEKIDYIHNNPVRRKLVTQPLDWPWSSATAYANLPNPLPLDSDNLPYRPEKRS